MSTVDAEAGSSTWSGRSDGDDTQIDVTATLRDGPVFYVPVIASATSMVPHTTGNPLLQSGLSMVSDQVFITSTSSTAAELDVDMPSHYESR
jgi:hypothetical protein